MATLLHRVLVNDIDSGKTITPAIQYVFEGEEIPSDANVLIELNEKGEIKSLKQLDTPDQLLKYKVDNNSVLHIEGNFGLFGSEANTQRGLFQDFSIRSELLTNLVEQTKEAKLLTDREFEIANESAQKVLVTWKQIETKHFNNNSNSSLETRAPQELWKGIKHMSLSGFKRSPGKARSDSDDMLDSRCHKQKGSDSPMAGRVASKPKPNPDRFGYMPWHQLGADNPFRTSTEKGEDDPNPQIVMDSRTLYF
eukprot:TRINITY_DN6451_c0_g1_i1.p1 TRINITY_DN6451_c0_g1~~TRINITY_DN6451_c0_g1_i1.p1  ORF type:complete len:266 (+),score=49.84 TRINITY_DN6451_c0_g1_i1:43-798(+)